MIFSWLDTLHTTNFDLIIGTGTSQDQKIYGKSRIRIGSIMQYASNSILDDIFMFRYIAYDKFRLYSDLGMVFLQNSWYKHVPKPKFIENHEFECVPIMQFVSNSRSNEIFMFKYIAYDKFRLYSDLGIVFLQNYWY